MLKIKSVKEKRRKEKINIKEIDTESGNIQTENKLYSIFFCWNDFWSQRLESPPPSNIVKWSHFNLFLSLSFFFFASQISIQRALAWVYVYSNSLLLWHDTLCCSWFQNAFGIVLSQLYRLCCRHIISICFQMKYHLHNLYIQSQYESDGLFICSRILSQKESISIIDCTFSLICDFFCGCH